MSTPEDRLLTEAECLHLIDELEPLPKDAKGLVAFIDLLRYQQDGISYAAGVADTEAKCAKVVEAVNHILDVAAILQAALVELKEKP